MITDAVQKIGGTLIAVKGLMKPGVDPHTYRARESDIHALIAADIIFYNGLHLEGKLAEILEKLSTKTTIAIADALPKNQLLQSPEFENLYDPHIWFDITLWMHVVTLIRDTLITHDPAHAALYTNNADLYLEQLHNVHVRITQQIEIVPREQRILITAHDAFNYFGRAYDFDVVGLQGISTESQAGTADIKKLVDLIVSKKIPTIFVESSVPQRTIQAVQQSAHARSWPVAIGEELYSDALGTKDSPAATYIDMMQYTVDTITQALLNRDHTSIPTS